MRFAVLLIGLTAASVSPLLAQPREPEWEPRLTLPPLLITQEASNGARGSVLWPFIHWRTVGGETEWGVRPLFNVRRSSSADRRDLDILWPLIKWERDEDRLDWRLFPFAGGWRVNRQMGDPDRYFIAFPLVWLQRDPLHRNTIILPYMRIREAEREGQVTFDALLPLFFRARDDRNAEQTTFLFPFLWRRERGELAEFDIFPLYWHRWGAPPHRLLILPLFGESEDIDTEGNVLERTRMILPPLWVKSEWNNGQQRRTSLLWPLIAWGGGGGTRLNRFLPLYSYQEYTQSGEGFQSRDLFVPPVLIARHYQAGELYERRVTSPLFWWWWGPDSGDRLTESWGVYPLFNGGSTETVGTHFSVFDPLFFIEGTETHSRFALLWRLFHRTESEDGDSLREEALWRLYHRTRDGDRSRVSIFPFLTFEREPHHRRAAFLWRVFELTREPEGRFLRLFFSPRIPLAGGPETPAP